jgi:hypothetical protein
MGGWIKRNIGGQTDKVWVNGDRLGLMDELRKMIEWTTN